MKNVPNLHKNKFLQEQMKNEFLPVETIDLLSEQEEMFCQLFCHGKQGVSGNQVAVYKAIFDEEDDAVARIESNKLLCAPAISSRIGELAEAKFENSSYVKLRVMETLMSIMDETATKTYQDRFGINLSPAPLRSVAVNAAKTLADIAGIRSGANENSKIELNGENNNVTFNVIVPNTK